MEVTFVLGDKQEKVVKGRVGATLLEIIEENDLPVFGGCGGAGVCGSCRVKIDPEGILKVGPAEGQELETLEMFQTDDDGVRLACQITLTEACDGLRVILG